MPFDIVVGLEWGDEGKGKLVDWLVERNNYRAVARYQGGHNAGHTVKIRDATYIFHSIPSGVLHPGVYNIIGNGTVVSIGTLRKEMEELQSKGVKITPENLAVSDRAHVIMPYHVAAEKSDLSKKIDTTGRGIGPAYTDKAARSGIRTCDLLYLDRPDVRDRLLTIIKNHGDENPESTLASLRQEFEPLKPFVTDTSILLNDLLGYGEEILCEGAQATCLDVDHGTYPFVTSSNASVGGAITGLGIPPTELRDVIGVAKAYTTRVGNGPFPTELDNEIGERLRRRGCEFGASTGRPRRCGWKDMVLLDTSVRINGVTKLAIMKLDVLDEEREINVCTVYRLNGENIDYMPATLELFSECRPVYDKFTGWLVPTHGATSFKALPENTKKYIEFIFDNASVPIEFLSVGPEREQTIIMPKL
jgi:adenylosuccinate synthase